MSKKTQEKPPKETKEPVKQPEVTAQIWHAGLLNDLDCRQEEERNAEDGGQAELFSSKVSLPVTLTTALTYTLLCQVKEILEKAGEKYLDLSFKKIRNMIEIDMDIKIEGDAKSSLKAITHELFQQHAESQ